MDARGGHCGLEVGVVAVVLKICGWPLWSWVRQDLPANK
jgi:hypothetical protein